MKQFGIKHQYFSPVILRPNYDVGVRPIHIPLHVCSMFKVCDKTEKLPRQTNRFLQCHNFRTLSPLLSAAILFSLLSVRLVPS